MTLIDIGESLPWSGRLTEGAVGDAGPYTHLQWQELWGNGSPYGAQANAGIVPGSVQIGPLDNAPTTEPLQVIPTSPASADVTITPGTAIVQGIKYTLDTATDVTVPANASGNPRIDAIVLRADYAGQTVRPYYLQGTAAASPVAPTLTRTGAPSGFWDVALVYIEVANGFTTITDVNLQNGRQMISPDRLGFIVASLSGMGPAIPYEPGMPLVLNNAGAIEVGTANRVGYAHILGVSEHYVESELGLFAGRCISHGMAFVQVDSAVSRGQYLEASSTSGQARGTTTPENAFGIALTASTGAGQKVLAIITARIPNQPAYLNYIGTTSGAITSGAWYTRALTSEVTDTAGIGSLAANQVTLAAGTYYTQFRAGGYGIDSHQSRLRNTTAGTTLIAGQPSFAPSTSATVNQSEGRGRFTLAVSSVLELQHRGQTSNANINAQGIVAGFGETEAFSQVEFWRLLT